jgi:hypothetical protein
LPRNREIRHRAPTRRDYTGDMEIRRATYGAAVRLALVFSAVSALVAMMLDALGEVSTTRLVVAVAAIGFATSWVQTGRVVRAVETRAHHRVTVMPLRQPIG